MVRGPKTCVNDASTDGTCEVVKAFMDQDRQSASHIRKRVAAYSDGIYDTANNLAIDMDREAEKFFAPADVTRIDHERRMARFYVLDVQPDLFGEWCFVRPIRPHSPNKSGCTSRT